MSRRVGLIKPTRNSFLPAFSAFLNNSRLDHFHASIIIHSMTETDILEATTNYYNSKEATAYQQLILGAESSHIGIYEHEKQSIADACHNTTVTMIQKLPKFKKSSIVLDIGSGYGTISRYIAEEFGCKKITCLNISTQENKVNESKNKKAQLGDLITVTAGNFESILADSESFDVILSQDALMYSKDKDKVFSEVAWVLKPGGRFIFTDLLESATCPDGALDAIYEHFPNLDFCSTKSYKRLTLRRELDSVYVKELPEHLVTHYKKLQETLKTQGSKLSKKSSAAFVKKQEKGIQLLLDAAEKGHLSWGILQFQKRNM